jgi:hypothetical protein
MRDMKATITKTRDAMIGGPYIPTLVDAFKAAADFRLTAVCPNVIVWKNGKEDRISDRILEKLQAAHTWATDF